MHEILTQRRRSLQHCKPWPWLRVDGLVWILVSFFMLRRDLGLLLPRVMSILMLLRQFYFSGLLYSKYLQNTSSKEPTYTTVDMMQYPPPGTLDEYPQSKSTFRQTAAWYRTSRSNLHEIRTPWMATARQTAQSSRTATGGAPCVSRAWGFLPMSPPELQLLAPDSLRASRHPRLSSRMSNVQTLHVASSHKSHVLFKATAGLAEPLISHCIAAVVAK